MRTRNVDVKQEEAERLLEEGYRARVETAYGRGRRKYRYLVLRKGEERRRFPLTPELEALLSGDNRRHNVDRRQAEAVELFRRGEVMNPNDLVLKLGYSFEEAESVFDRIVDNEGVAVADVRGALQRLEKAMDEARGERMLYVDLLNKVVALAGGKEKVEEDIRELEGRVKSISARIAELSNLVRSGERILEDLKSTEGRLEGASKELEGKVRRAEDVAKYMVKLTDEVTETVKLVKEASKRFAT